MYDSDMQEIETVLAEQELDEKQKQVMNRAYARVQIWSDGDREILDRARVARKIMLLQDPYQDRSDIEPERATLQLQTLRSTIVNCIADQMDNMPEGVMVPERPELQQQADDLTDVNRYVLNENNYEELHNTLVEDYFVTGTAVIQVGWDKDMDDGEGNISIVRWPIEGFLWDPRCSNIDDARALFKISWHPLSWYRSRYPDAGRYVACESGEYRNIGMPEEWLSHGPDEEMAMLMEYWEREYDAKKRRYKVNVAYIAGNAVLEMHEDVYAHGKYPFIVKSMFPIDGMPVGEGLVQTMAPMMRYINRYARYIDENLAMSAKIRMLVQRGAGIDVEALADWDKNLIEGDRIDEDAVRWMQSQPLNSMAFNLMLQFETDIKQDSGQNQFTRGETAGGVTAASAISALQEAGGKITRLNTNRLNQAFKEMVEQVVWLINQFYTGRQARLITGRRGDLRMVDMDAEKLMGMIPKLPEGAGALPPQQQAEMILMAAQEALDRKRGGALPPPPYSVQIQVQRRNPLRVQAQNESILQAYAMAAQANIPFKLSTAFELLALDGKEKIIPALQESEAQMDQMNALTQQMGQMQQENDALKKQLKQYGSQMRSQEQSQITDMPPGLSVKTGME